MFIQTEETPNPETLKFMPGRAILDTGTADFPTAESAVKSPLAQQLFAIDGVAGVFFGSDFVTITKASGADWFTLKPFIFDILVNYLVLHEKVQIEPSHDSNSSSSEVEAGSIAAEIKELLDSRVRPAVAMDGGDIIFEKFEKGIVYLKLQGACAGCPSSTMTLKSGIENMLRYYVPEVTEVCAVE